MKLFRCDRVRPNNGIVEVFLARRDGAEQDEYASLNLVRADYLEFQEGEDYAVAVQAPATGKIRLRFVRDKGWKYTVVAWRGGISMPFTPTHAECVTPEGKCLGMHGKPHDGFPAGMVEREAGYDAKTLYVMPDGRRCEILVDLPCTKEQQDTFYDFMRKAIGEPYDWAAPWGFLLGGHHHTKFNSTCSAKVIMGLRACGYFRWPLTKPAHELNPADLLAILSTHVEIPH